ncbi:MAG: pyridine nucleotide-disulfide oxidoreductase/dicluster-binding protein [Desulfovibrionaceae bacterium]
MDQKDLRRWEARCIQEEPPRCQAACPLSVDARKFCSLMARGRNDEALGVLARSMPLPRLLARICDAPCEAACLRAEAGGAVRLGDLERRCVEAATKAPRILPLPARGKTAAVLGGGLAGLSAAWDLGRKGFTVTLMGPRPVGLLGAHIPSDIPFAAVDEELALLAKLRVSFAGEPPLTGDGVRALLERFDAVFVDPEVLPAAALDLGEADPVSLGTQTPGVFAAGPEFAPGAPGLTSAVALAGLGRRAAGSIERFTQGASLTAGREREGVFETRLTTPLDTVESAPPVAGPLDAERAKAEAARCLQCECRICVRDCAYLEHYQGYPKVYARQIYNNAAIVRGTRMANAMINSCMLCGLCAGLCPEDFDMGELCLEARRELVAQGHMPPSAHEFALRDMAFADGPHAALARHAPGRTASSLLFFPGCQLTASDPGAVERAYAWLRAKHPDTGLMLRCCGIPARWAGREDAFAASLAELKAQWEGLGRPAIVAACPTCLRTLREALPEAAPRSLWGLMRELGRPEGAHTEATLAVHDPCTSRDDAELHADVRALLADLGVTCAEPRLTQGRTECCGFGGLLSEANPELGRTVAERRAAAMPGDAVTYCAMCRDQLARAGRRCAHLLDLLLPDPEAPAADPAARPAPGYTDRRENRARLRQRLLAELWREPGAEPEPFEAVAVRFTPEAARVLEERRILKSDVQKTLLAAQQSGRWLRQADTGLLLARRRPMHVTYWVLCEPDPETPGGWLAHSAWSHRMSIHDEAINATGGAA